MWFSSRSTPTTRFKPRPIKATPRAIEVLPEYEAWAEMRRAMYATLLRSAADLPEFGLDDPTLFVWDQESAGDSEEWTVVRIAGTGTVE
ncbi:hypothetical protein BH24CHL7_BH24CHL7_01290 [soil metagenome]